MKYLIVFLLAPLICISQARPQEDPTVKALATPKDLTKEDGTHEDGTHKDGTHEDETHKDETHEDETHEDEINEEYSIDIQEWFMSLIEQIALTIDVYVSPILDELEFSRDVIVQQEIEYFHLLKHLGIVGEEDKEGAPPVESISINETADLPKTGPVDDNHMNKDLPKSPTNEVHDTVQAE